MGLLGLYTTDEFGQEDFHNFERSGTVESLAAFTTDCDYNAVRQSLGYAPFETHPTDVGQKLLSITNKRTATEPSIFEDPTNPSNTANGTPCFWWQITANFGAINPLEITQTGNPFDQPFSVSFQWEVFETAVDIAITGYNPDGSYQYSPVVNSAGDPFDPPVTRDALRGVIGVEQNVVNFNPASFFLQGCCINNDVFNGFPPFYVKLTPPNMPERLYSQFLGSVYYRLNYEFQINPYGWNATPIDRGFNRLVGSSKQKILDLNGMPVSDPVLLDGSGNPLPVGSSSYHAFNFQVYPDISFNSAFPQFQDLFQSLYF